MAPRCPLHISHNQLLASDSIALFSKEDKWNAAVCTMRPHWNPPLSCRISWWNLISLYDCMKKGWNETHLWVVEFQRPSISMALDFINRIHRVLKIDCWPFGRTKHEANHPLKFNNRMRRRNQESPKKKSNAWHKFQKKWVWIKDLEMKEEMKPSNRRRITRCEWRMKAKNAWMREGERVLFVLLGRLTPNIYGLGEEVSFIAVFHVIN